MSSPDQLYARGYRAISWAIGIGEADSDPQKFLWWVKWLMNRIENTGEVPEIYAYRDIPPLEPAHHVVDPYISDQATTVLAIIKEDPVKPGVGRIIQLQKRIKELKAALEPFAKCSYFKISGLIVTEVVREAPCGNCTGCTAKKALEK